MKYYFIPPWIDIYTSSDNNLFIKSPDGRVIKIDKLYVKRAESLIYKLKKGIKETELVSNNEEDIFYHLLSYNVIQISNTKDEINKLKYLDRKTTALLSSYGYQFGKRILSKISKSKILIFPLSHFSNLLGQSLSRINFQIDILTSPDNNKYNNHSNESINFIAITDIIEMKKFVSERCKEYDLIICATDKPENNLHLYSTNIGVKNAIPNLSCWVEKSQIFAGPLWVSIGTSCFNCSMLRRASSAEDFEEFVSYNTYINNENKCSSYSESGLRIMCETIAIDIEHFLGMAKLPDLMNNLLIVDVSSNLKITYEKILRVNDCEVCGNDRTF
jgi:hypothetical protein